jgi:hypothetical protein
MAQEFPPLVVFSIQTTSNIEVDPPIEEGSPCVDAISALRQAGLRQQETNVIEESFLAIVLTRQGLRRGAATLVCAAEGTEPPTEPEPTP